mgnify:CR=1 FL=1
MAVVCAGMATPAHADGPDTYGVGSRNAALGSAMAGGVSDWSAAWFNPAGLAAKPGLQAGGGVQGAQDSFRPIDDVVLGCVMQVGEQGLNIGRSAVLAAEPVIR